MQTYDFAVVGGGSAGYAAAATANQLGLKTVCIEGGEEVGGLCILRGCMPSKTLIESANRFMTLRRAGEFGLNAGHIGFDVAKIIKRKRDLISGFAQHRADQLASGEFRFVRGWAEFTDSHHLKIRLLEGGFEEIEAKTFLLATGSEIHIMDIPGLKETGFITSDIALDSERIPSSVIMLGGGPTALEFAHFYNALGNKVIIVQRSSQVLKGADSDVSEALMEAFERRNMDILCDTQLLGTEKTDSGKRVILKHGGKTRSVEAEEIFYALGRRPTTRKLQAELAGIKFGTDGRAIVNDELQTSTAHIFAAGDVNGIDEVVHLAIEQGILAAQNARRLLSGERLVAVDHRLKLFIMFTEPQVAYVGLTEKEAIRLGRAYRSAKHLFTDHGKSMVRGETDGFVKLIVDAYTNEIIGGAVIGPDGSELIHEIVVAMHFRSTAATLAKIPHYHPTLSEIWTYPAEELQKEADEADSAGGGS